MRQAVLFDVGGPIDLEIAYERMIDAALRAASGADEAALRAASARAVARFAPNAYRAVLFDLMGDAAPAAWARLVAGLPPPPPIELRPGMAALLGGLAARGVRLGLAANQPASVLARLAAAGLDGVFTGIALSGTTGFAKPDPRLFLHACAGLGVTPGACIMVGDRIDNDIGPARRLGMAAVLIRTGRHAGQQPRDWQEVPDAEVTDVDGMAAALDRLLAG